MRHHIVHSLAIALWLLCAPVYGADRAYWLASQEGATPLVGVQVKLQSFNANDARKIHNAGFAFVRMGVWTDRMGRADYRRALDQAITAAHAAGLPVLLTVRSLGSLAPRAVSRAARAATLAQAGDDMAGLVAQLDRQYGSQLLAIELWNEPDQSKYWPTGDVEETFAPFMHAACERLAVRKPSVPVLGFAFARVPLGGSAAGRLLQPLAGQLPRCLDAISYHAYGMTADQIRAASQALRKRYGLPIAITEDGATSAGLNGADRQAKRVAMLMQSVDAQSASLISIYEWADTPDASDTAQRHYGLLRADRTAKPAFDVIERALRDARASRSSTAAPGG
ncbi:beta-xylosidase [Dyella monticola]|uniref:Beta-xylosidase n=1 Tax=Dyella monticola TaxID=1927958 RepID=A0A370X083_9GAMM|nr:cellulase family glycosylhydrolase [Dyella monticola]RDS81667.1 beta-xylosidase [Dyella monticola]